MDYPGYMPAAGIPRILNESTLLLLLTNKTGDGGPKGFMTTKFFEYLAVGKPVLCVRGDEGCLEEVINRTRAGLSAHHADEVYGFIKKHYLRWLAGKPCEDHSDREEIKKFSRKEQAQQFIEIFEQVVTQALCNDRPDS
jgi:glycosyltransferase involved in cell wall biosynthesis